MVPLLALLSLSQANGIEGRIDALLRRMTIEEKLGQMSQTGLPGRVTDAFRNDIRKGRYGSVYGWGSAAVRAELERVSLKESRLGIPLIIGHDVIHGCATGLPIPLGQAASWDPELVRACSRISAREAAATGVHWTFSPMMDIARDPRWGRIAEGYGEDPMLASAMAVATVRGYQGSSLSAADSIAACGKHYVGYGAAEGGRDYNTTWIPETELRDVYLKPFQATKEAGIASFMSAFNAINGVPASANPLTLRQILRKEWKFDGLVVSDYTAVHELIQHGVAADGAEAAQKAIQAGVDMEMVSDDYFANGKALIASNRLDPRLIDDSVRNILRIKFRLGLFDGRPQPTPKEDPKPTAESLALSRKLASESFVLLKNEANRLPLASDVGAVAVIGPLADSKQDQLGSWSNANSAESITPLQALRDRLGKDRVLYAPGLVPPATRDRGSDATTKRMLLEKNMSGFGAAIEAAKKADVVLVFLGETANMSGEANARAFLDLPGAQNELVSELAKLGKPLVGIVMAGRPLTLHDAAENLNSLLYVWHPGTMAGPAIVDTLFGESSPSGKLPVTFPRSVGQIPIYYNHLNTGRPAAKTGPAAGDHYRSKYIDADFTPEYPFGFGLSYTTFRYSAPRMVSKPTSSTPMVFACEVTNSGRTVADEVAQFYVHQESASIARPVRELKGFQRIRLKPGETKTVRFNLAAADFAFHNSQMKLVVEPGKFEAWIAPDSASGVPLPFEILAAGSLVAK